MPYKKGDENNYFPWIISLLIGLAGAIGIFFYAAITSLPVNIELEEGVDVPTVDPMPSMPVPSGPPEDIVPPSEPPPGA